MPKPALPAELALAASEAMLQLVLDTIPQLVHWKDKRLRIIGANRNFRVTLEGPPEIQELGRAGNAEAGRTNGWQIGPVIADIGNVLKGNPEFACQRAQGDQLVFASLQQVGDAEIIRAPRHQFRPPGYQPGHHADEIVLLGLAVGTVAGHATRRPDDLRR